MDIRVLGSLQVLIDGVPVEIRGTKRRELLCLLVMQANRAVIAASLVESLWEGDPPPTASSALRVHVQHLREVLEPDRDASTPTVLTAVAQGYRLHVGPDDTDAARFERLVVDGRDADLQGDPRCAITLLTRALEEWRGAPYGDACSLSAVRSEVARLEELRAAALEDLVEARLTLGEHTLAIELLARAVDEFPLRERLTAQLMRALYRSGRQAEALRAYSKLEQRLDEELAVAPSGELRALERDVLLQNATLDWVPPRPRHDADAGRPATLRFVSRQRELRVLLESYARVEGGERRAVVVSGAGGIGKTTLVSEFCNRVRAHGAVVLTGQCDEDRIVDMLPLIEISRALAERLDPAVRDARAGELARLLPERREELPEQEPASDVDETEDGDPRARVYEAFTRLVARRPAGPLVLVVEDAQWVDRSSLLALQHLLRDPESAQVLVIVTYRDDEIALARSDLLDHIAASRRLDTVNLRGFGDSEVRALVRSIAPAEASNVLDALAPLLHDMTGGNPLFLRELLRELDAQPIRFDDRASVERALEDLAPSSVLALIERRTKRLSGDARAVLDAAAVLGRDITAAALADVCELTLDATFDALDDPLALGVVLSDPMAPERLRFSHHLVRTALYTRIAEHERRRFHRRVAEVLARDASVRLVQPTEIAHHAYEARPLIDAAPVAVRARAAADDAMQRLAFWEAARWYARAIALESEVGAGPETLGGLHFALGRAQESIDDVDGARTAYLAAATCARVTADARLLADVAVAFNGPWTSGFEVADNAITILEEALVALGDDDPHRRVRVLNALAAACYHVDPDREARAAHEAVELAQTLDDASIAAARLALHRSYTHRPEAVAERLELAKTACDITRGSAHSQLHLHMEREYLTDLLENGLVDEFDRQLDSYEELASKTESLRHQYWAGVLRATQALLRGDLRAAEQLARGAALRGRALRRSAAGAQVLQHFVARYQQGRLGELVAALRQVPDVQPAYRAGYALAAVACAETGRPDEGARIARRALGPDGSLLRRDVFWLAGVALFGGVAAGARDHDLVRLVRALLEPHGEQIVVFGAGGAVLGCGHHWLGPLAAAAGDLDAAIAHLERAWDRAEDLRSPYWIAHAQVAEANVRIERGSRGDDAQARALTEAALGIARAHGFERIIAHAPPAAV